MECIKVVLWFFEKVERVSRQRKARACDHRSWQDRFVSFGKSTKRQEWPPRKRRKHDGSGTVRIALQDSWNPIPLQFERVFRVRLSGLYQALPKSQSLSFC